MSDDELARLQSLADAATPGPWEWSEDRAFLFIEDRSCTVLWCEYHEGKPGEVWFVHGDIQADGSWEIGFPHIDDREVGDWRPAGTDAAFIAASRTAVPELIAEVRRLKAELVERNRAIKTGGR